ncbi:MAG: uracil phosphoribosyltransferase [Parvularculaceae bacterium]|nr:uracil phosphoribosyltransferase [Parvularculaceae bacterium]
MVTIVSHPLVQHKLTLMREKSTDNALFRETLREVSFLIAYEVTKDLQLGARDIETPLEKGSFPWLEGRRICFISILRAGNGLLEGMLDLIPDARVGHIGLYRDHETLQPVRYYMKLPEAIGEREVIVVDPMLATGNSSVAAVTMLKEAGAARLKFMCLLAAPEGVAAFETAHPDVPVFTAAIDRGLNEKGYILPGLGDAGDRIYGTV